MNSAYIRIKESTGLRTQTEIANALGISQSSVSDALRRGETPATWLVTLLEKYSLNPFWIKTGRGFQYMAPVSTGEEKRRSYAVGRHRAQHACINHRQPILRAHTRRANRQGP